MIWVWSTFSYFLPKFYPPKYSFATLQKFLSKQFLAYAVQTGEPSNLVLNVITNFVPKLASSRTMFISKPVLFSAHVGLILGVDSRGSRFQGTLNPLSIPYAGNHDTTQAFIQDFFLGGEKGGKLPT